MSHKPDESEVAQYVQLEASRLGVTLWRNNSGALKDAEGRVVRYGLGNISKKINEAIKSSDYIGITPVVITPEMVGQTLGVFTAIETKKPGVSFGARERAQKAFIDFVLKKGGFAGFVSDPSQVQEIVRKK